MSTSKSTNPSSVHEEINLPTGNSQDGVTDPRNAIIEQYEPYAEGLAGKFAKSFPWLKDDLVQEARIALWHALERYDGTRGVPFKAYAYRVIRGGMLDYVNREMRHVEGRVLGDWVDECDERSFEIGEGAETGPAAEADAADLSKQIQAASHVLTDREREVLDLMYWSDSSGTEIAKKLGISNARISTLAANARERLRSELNMTQ